MQNNSPAPLPDTHRPIRTDGPRIIYTDRGPVIRPDRPGSYPPYSTVYGQDAPAPP